MFSPYVTFDVMKLGNYVIVDNSSNYVMFHELNVRMKVKNNNSSQQELGPPVFQCERFVQPSSPIQQNSYLNQQIPHKRLQASSCYLYSTKCSSMLLAIKCVPRGNAGLSMLQNNRENKIIETHFKADFY